MLTLTTIITRFKARRTKRALELAHRFGGHMTRPEAATAPVTPKAANDVHTPRAQNPTPGRAAA